MKVKDKTLSAFTEEFKEAWQRAEIDLSIPGNNCKHSRKIDNDTGDFIIGFAGAYLKIINAYALSIYKDHGHLEHETYLLRFGNCVSDCSKLSFPKFTIEDLKRSLRQGKQTEHEISADAMEIVNKQRESDRLNEIEIRRKSLERYEHPERFKDEKPPEKGSIGSGLKQIFGT